jgi:hypothetical protein
MNLTRTIIRGLLSALAILILIYLNVKTRDNIGLVAEFKFETFDKMMDNIKSDSLYMKQRLGILHNETTRFTGQILEDTSHVREGIHYLMGVLGLFITSELGFFLIKRKKGQTTHVSVKPNSSQQKL